MNFTIRQEEIIEILQKNKTVTVEFLADTLFVSPMTIRRDLKELELQGAIKRFHGGAMVVSEEELSVDMRLNLSAKEKETLGKKAIQHVKDFDVVFLDCSSTCCYLLPYLKNFVGIKVVTNSVEILLMASNLHIPCVISGGTFCKKEMSLQGASACEFLSALSFNVAFFSSSGYSNEGVISDHDEELTNLRKVVMKRAQKSIFMFDRSKLNKKYLYTVCKDTEVDEIIIP